jgi:hypothetical protein
VFKKENQNLEQKFEKIGDFNRLSVKEKAEIILIAMLVLGVVVASYAFLVSTFAGMTAAGTYGVGASGTFGTYNYLAILGTAEFAKSAAGVILVKAGVGAAGAGLLAGGIKLANKGDELTKKYIERLLPKPQKVEIVTPINPLESQTPIPQTPPSAQNNQILNPENKNSQPQNQSPFNLKPDNVEINRGLNLVDLKARFKNIMDNNDLTEEQQNQAVNGMLNSTLIRFRSGAKEVKINEAIEICLLTNNYEM